MKVTAALAIFAAAIAGLLVFDYLRPGEWTVVGDGFISERDREKLEARIRKAEERSQHAKGVYVTSTVAQDRGRVASKLRADILRLLEETELNAVVIDIKETEGGLIITNELRDLILELHQKDAWVIARLVVFKDGSQERVHPEWYLRRRLGTQAPKATTTLTIWRDRRGGSWLDPASREVWAYQLAAAKAAADAGFDEIQFDYIRFPSDGDVAAIAYPVYDGARPKYEVLREFFGFLHDELKAYRPELVLSADLFGYVALESEDLGIGQRLADIGENFDYVSLMVYPSHYYGGLEVAADQGRNLPAVAYPYRASDPSRAAASHPYEVVYRTLLIADDVLSGRATSTPASATSTAASLPASARRVKLRPWLQDFDLAVDSARGIRYDASKVRAQIDAAEAAGASGWLLWSPDNVYTRDALKPE